MNLIFLAASKSLPIYFVPGIVLDASDIVVSQKCPCPQAAHSLVGDKGRSK